MTTTTEIDFGAIKTAQRAVRFLGRFAEIARQFNRVDVATVVAPSRYLEAVGVGR